MENVLVVRVPYPGYGRERISVLMWVIVERLAGETTQEVRVSGGFLKVYNFKLWFFHSNIISNLL